MVEDDMTLAGRDHFIFDLDGTLTQPVHDFVAIANLLGLVPGQPILEALARMPAERADPLRAKLAQWELDLAHSAQPAPFAREVLERLLARGARIGILTRNSRENAVITLRAAGLLDLFPLVHVIGRQEAAIKPSPDGVHVLLRAWGGHAERAAMVGDYLYDLQAARAAGVLAVHYVRDGAASWPEYTDLEIRDLRQLLLEPGAPA
jgi:HAD superfamily hydrolase (TIGR01549 family)